MNGVFGPPAGPVPLGEVLAVVMEVLISRMRAIKTKTGSGPVV